MIEPAAVSLQPFVLKIVSVVGSPFHALEAGS
jgi:hypothetical protein